MRSQIEKLLEELRKVRKEALEAARGENFRKVAKLTLLAAAINNQLETLGFDWDTRTIGIALKPRTG